MPVIKRYPNRKLYDTEEKQYITLDEIARLIRKGVDVRVIDHSTGEDQTALTLTQIILEQEKKQAGFLPHHLLAGLIQTGGDRLSAVHRNLIASLGMGSLIDDEIKRRLEELVNAGALTAEEGISLHTKLTSPPASARAGLMPGERIIARILKERGVPSRDELKRLMDQIDSLAAKLDDLAPDEQPPGQDDPV